MTNDNLGSNLEKSVGITSLLANRNFIIDEKNMIRKGAVIEGQGRRMQAPQTPSQTQENSPAMPSDIIPSVATISLFEHQLKMEQQQKISMAEGEKIGFDKGYETALQNINLQEQQLYQENIQNFSNLLAKFHEYSQIIAAQEAELLKITQWNIYQICQIFLDEFVNQKSENLIANEIKSHFRFARNEQRLIIHINPQYRQECQNLLNKIAIASDKYELVDDKDCAHKQIEIEHLEGGISLRLDKYQATFAKIRQFMQNMHEYTQQHTHADDDSIQSIFSAPLEELIPSDAQNRPEESPNQANDDEFDKNLASDQENISQIHAEYHAPNPDIPHINQEQLPDDLPANLIRDNDANYNEMPNESVHGESVHGESDNSSASINQAKASFYDDEEEGENV